MEAKEFYLKVDTMIAKEPGTLNGKEVLSDNSLFDSLGMMEVIIYLDEECGLTMAPEKIVALGTLENLYLHILAHANLK